MIKLSVIVPAYNVANYIKDCIVSILDEQYPHKEIIIIDDGSTDETSVILDELQAEYPELIIKKQENRGLSATRNRGIRLSTGDYIAFVDSDDVVSETMYKEMIDTLCDSTADIVTTGVARLGEHVYPSVLHEHFMQTNKQCTSIYETTDLLYDTTSWNKIYRATFFKEHGFLFPEGKTFEDIPVVVPAYLHTKRVNIVKKAHYFWRVRSGSNQSITQQKNNIKQVNDRLDALYTVDAAFRSLAITGNLLAKKEYKFLEIDLFSMIEWLFLAPKDVFNAISEQVTAYMNKQLVTNQLQYLPKRKRKMFLALLDGRSVRFKWHSRLYFLQKVARKIKL